MIVGVKNKDETIFVTRPFLPPKEEFDAYCAGIWKRDQLTNNGPLVQRLAKELKDYLGAKQVNLMVNGHQALDVAIKGLGLSGEVITTPFTFASTTHALTLNGIRPVFCDIRESDLTMDPEQIEPLINEKTTAIMPVHVYGHACDVEKIDAIAKKHHLKVIYDAAHTFGAKKDGRALSCYGDVSMISFHATKLYHTIEGGALVYEDESYTRLFNAYKNFGIEGEDHVDLIGGNAKMNEFQAAMGLSNLPYIDRLIEERRQITQRYRELLSDLPGIRFFEPEKQPGIEHNYAYFPILIDAKRFGVSRDRVYAKLKEQNIFTRRYFWPIVPDFECYHEEHQQDVLPVTRRAGDEVLCLPIYNGLSLQQVERIVNEMRSAAQ